MVVTRPSHAIRGGRPPASFDRPPIASKHKHNHIHNHNTNTTHKPYKIVLEAIEPENGRQKKLRYKVTSELNPPPGYYYVAVGYPDLTSYCKSLCRDQGQQIIYVSPTAKEQNDPDKISGHCHRIGTYFPITVVSTAIACLGYQPDGNNSFIKYGNPTPIAAQDTRGDQGTADATSEVTSPEKIKITIRDLFPRIPDGDLQAVVKHAFQVGAQRVGDAQNLSLARKVQLATVAHIRHRYTEYDQLLKTVGWLEARKRCEPISLAKVKEWRDENDEDESFFREIIVIEDDVDEDEEYVPTQSSPLDAVRPQINDVAVRNFDGQNARLPPRGSSSVMEQRRFIHGISSSRDTRMMSRMDHGRAQLPHPPNRPHTLSTRPPNPLSLAHDDSPATSRGLILEQAPTSRIPTQASEGMRDLYYGYPSRAASPPRIMRGSDGILYDLRPVKEHPGHVPELHYEYAAAEYMPLSSSLVHPWRHATQPRPVTHDKVTTAIRPSPLWIRPSDQDMVIPSIEHDENRPPPRRGLENRSVLQPASPMRRPHQISTSGYSEYEHGYSLQPQRIAPVSQNRMPPSEQNTTVSSQANGYQHRDSHSTPNKFGLLSSSEHLPYTRVGGGDGSLRRYVPASYIGNANPPTSSYNSPWHSPRGPYREPPAQESFDPGRRDPAGAPEGFFAPTRDRRHM